MAKLLEEEAMNIAREYVKQPEVQYRIRLKAIEGVERVMEALALATAEGIDDYFRNSYKNLLGKIDPRLK